MPNWVHRTTKQFLRSVPSAELPEALANYIEEPDLSAVTGQPAKYWVITGDTISLADQATRDAIDAAELAAQRDAIADQLQQLQTVTRAFAEVVMDEFNRHSARINGILDAIDNASNLAGVKSDVAAIQNIPDRTLQDLRDAVRAKLDL